MGIISCNSDCKYQKDGYCTLDSIEKINNSTVSQGCAYYINIKEIKESSEKDELNN
ncbi:MAG: hypothetical protein WBK75_02360 [Acutalibacteraceae bacterium]|nr:hypothetical protein [Clostridiales bacterium]